ncbi:hypothetical protein CKO28_15910 [Rhodovibrio sodomensis]|uniref:Tyr recombinase domain-containing protein n=2 Tax=Rhodovibrio sodomensis TaxID=1088 RepID=A0ABS1DGD1_9PROT|nr:hypothetical protein [Rhodovibrio sodomensis]
MKALESRLKTLRHTDLGVAKASAATITSHVRGAVALVDLNSQQRLQKSMLTGDWAALVAEIRSYSTGGRRGLGHFEAKIWPLVEYCFRHGIPAANVSDDTIQELWTDLEKRKVARPFETARATIYAWEALQSKIPTWPATKLNRIHADGLSSPHSTFFQHLPDDLKADWAAYVEANFGDRTQTGSDVDLTALVVSATDSEYVDPFADTEPALPGRLRSKESEPNMRTVMTYAANAAIHDIGFMPHCLTDLLNERVLRRTLSRQYLRQQQRAHAKGEARPSKRNSTLKFTVSVFKAIATDLGLPDDLVAAFDGYYDRFHPDVTGWKRTKDGHKRTFRKQRIGPRHARMLDQFVQQGGDAKLLAWWRLPEGLLGHVRKRLSAVGDPALLSDKELNDANTAVVAGILRGNPLRRENIAELRIGAPGTGLEPNLRIPEDPKGHARIWLSATEVKNQRETTVIVTQFATEALRFYRDWIRPEVMRRRGSDPQNPYLFPTAGMTERPHTKHARDYHNRAWQAGFWLDLHANRHLTAKLVLDQDPSAMDIVQKVLGHTKKETTEAYYAEINDLLAQKTFQELLGAFTADLADALRLNLQKAPS